MQTKKYVAYPNYHVSDIMLEKHITYGIPDDTETPVTDYFGNEMQQQQLTVLSQTLHTATHIWHPLVGKALLSVAEPKVPVRLQLGLFDIIFDHTLAFNIKDGIITVSAKMESTDEKPADTEAAADTEAVEQTTSTPKKK
jgi:hypothetical protein